MNKTCRPGFTLIEVLIALSIFAILATLTTFAISRAFETRARLDQQSTQQATFQLAQALFSHDVAQTIYRNGRGPEGQLIPGFIGQQKWVIFTHKGFVNPGGEEKRSTLQRVAYACENKQLRRKTWLVLDPIHLKAYEDRVLLNGLKGCHFAYLNHARSVLTSWHQQAVEGQTLNEPLPVAIKLTLSFGPQKSFDRLFLLPAGLGS